MRIEPLNALEAMDADNIIGASVSPMLAEKVYSICSLRGIKTAADADFVSVNPRASKLEFANVAKQFSLPEMARLAMEVEKITSADMDDNLKNALTAPPSA